MRGAEMPTPGSIMKEYSAGVSFNQGIGLYERVRQNEDFYVGEQWAGVNAPDLDKPVVNLLKRVVSYFISTIVSDDIAVGVSAFGADARQEAVCDMLAGQFAEIMETAGVKDRLRDAVRNAAVDGNACMHYYFCGEGGWVAGGDTPGTICAELLDNTAVFFGNPQVGEVEKQPYILLSFRRRVEEARAAAKSFGCDAGAIVPDAEAGGMVSPAAPEAGKVTVVRRYWRQGGTIWFADACQGGFLHKPVSTGYYRYPVAWMPWEKVKNRYHGQAAVTGMVPNQIYVNKMLAMAMQHVKMHAFPKVVYDRTKLTGGWSNQVGAAIGVTGNPNDAIATSFRPADMSGQVLETIDRTIQYTRETMGATDAALGNVKPENTSAIIAVQKATSMPLELQRMEFYRFVEDSVRIWLCMMEQNYGVRTVSIKSEEDEMGLQEMRAQRFNFAQLADMHLRLNVDVGASTYWSELMQVETLDNLFASGVITDPALYVELMPAAYLPGKQKLLEALAQAPGGQAAGQAGAAEGGATAAEAPVQGAPVDAAAADARPEEGAFAGALAALEAAIENGNEDPAAALEALKALATALKKEEEA